MDNHIFIRNILIFLKILKDKLYDVGYHLEGGLA